MEKLGRLPGYEFREEDQVTVRGQKRACMIGSGYKVCLSVVMLEAGFAPNVSGFSLNGDPKKIRQFLRDLERELDRLDIEPLPVEIVGSITSTAGLPPSTQETK